MVIGKTAATEPQGSQEPHHVESVPEAGTSAPMSHRGPVPPVAPLSDAATPPSASDRAFGEIGHSPAEDDAQASTGPRGTRFSGDSALGDVEHGFKTLKVGDVGPAVRKVQQALFELNYRPVSVTGTYDQGTADQVKSYQQARSLGHQDGNLDGATFAQLEKEFFDLSVYAKAAEHAPPGVHDTPKGTNAKQLPVLLGETNTLDDAAKAEANAVITPAKAAGTVGPFQQTIQAGTYGPRMEQKLLATIAMEAKDAEAKQHHHEKGPLFSMGEMANVGNAAKGQVDAVFGSWAKGEKLSATNLKDRFVADSADQAKLDATGRHGDARSRARYFLNTVAAFEELDTEHSADRTRDTEHAIIDKVLDRVAAAKERELLLITATWSASTDRAGVIKIQTMKSGNDDQDRDTLWKKFGTLIHEYIHSLAHPKWREYKDLKAKTDPQGAHTLTEGVTEFLTRTVVTQIKLSDPKLRKEVLGNIADDGEEPDLGRDSKYGSEYLRAEALVGVVGIHNLYAAYFLGETSLIGA